jgi:hypothetical protein
MTQLDDRLKAAGIKPDPVDTGSFAQRAARELAERAERGRRREPPPTDEEVRKREKRVAAFWRALGVRAIWHPVRCPGRQCRARRQAGINAAPSFHVSSGGGFYCTDCSLSGSLADAPRVFGRDPLPLLRQHGFDELAAPIERHRDALAAIEQALEKIGRDDVRWGSLRTARDSAESLEALEKVAERARKMRRKKAAA